MPAHTLCEEAQEVKWPLRPIGGSKALRSSLRAMSAAERPAAEVAPGQAGLAAQRHPVGVGLGIAEAISSLSPEEGTAPTWGTCRNAMKQEPEGHGTHISLFTSGSPAVGIRPCLTQGSTNGAGKDPQFAMKKTANRTCRQNWARKFSCRECSPE